MFDKICAIATPYGVGALSIVRTSGEGSIKAVNKIFKGADLNDVPGYRIKYGYIIDGTDIIDEVLVSIFRDKKSFTGEESVEISCHGGIFATNKILETLLKNGFRMARRGEFSERAFLNKRIDLTEAEAIMDIISADNMTSLKASTNSLRHSTKHLVDKYRNKLLNLIASIEVNIDYPEYDDAEEMTDTVLIPRLKELISEMDVILKKSRISKIAVHGITTAIVGKPNVGKSSILNMLLDEEKAIVSNFEGTTRDTVEASLSLGNITLHLVDTAGIRESTDYVENIGIKKTHEMIDKAELVLLILDGSKELTKEDKELLELTKDKKRIIIINKEDLDIKFSLDCEYTTISALGRTGLDKLTDKLIEVTEINEFNVDAEDYFSNVRHIALLEKAKNSLNDALVSSEDKEMVDMIEIDIKEAYESLGEITGETGPDQLLNKLFSNFCLGK